MGLLGGLLSGVLSALGLDSSSASSSTPSIQTVSTVGAEMNHAVSQAIGAASTLTSEGIGYASGESNAAITKADSLLSTGILGAENAIPSALSGNISLSSATATLNDLTSDGQKAGTTIADFASQMPVNVAQVLTDNKVSSSTTYTKIIHSS
ncbi:hypothetical protein H7F10_07440 [Acidithiobacillus sp. HP-6]|uniref:hypothetical protein n=1 Tax=Acidithiobacillus sp. HP-6 TaxID=2697655 RepID=UPI00187A45E9|nr:hypothetical protein [Acidithiobacillus sp. HP-6]MBE7562784.1 hypothetical protein [Acidithiobacillus sp. HP-6]